VFPRGIMVMQGCMAVVDALLVEALVEAGVGGFQGGASRKIQEDGHPTRCVASS
jgi:hypothetical protein